MIFHNVDCNNNFQDGAIIFKSKNSKCGLLAPFVIETESVCFVFVTWVARLYIHIVCTLHTYIVTPCTMHTIARDSIWMQHSTVAKGKAAAQQEKRSTIIPKSQRKKKKIHNIKDTREYSMLHLLAWLSPESLPHMFAPYCRCSLSLLLPLTFSGCFILFFRYGRHFHLLLHVSLFTQPKTVSFFFFFAPFFLCLSEAEARGMRFMNTPCSHYVHKLWAGNWHIYVNFHHQLGHESIR